VADFYVLHMALFDICIVASGTGEADWRADGYRWRQNGTSRIPRKSPVMQKVHFDVQTMEGNCKSFHKFVYSLIGVDDYVVVQYDGDSTVAQPYPHRMCKAMTVEHVHDLVDGMRNMKQGTVLWSETVVL